MTGVRRCTRTACGRTAIATLTYVYAESTAVLGPLSTAAEPHTYDLCGEHSQRLTAPRGWEVVRLDLGANPPRRASDDLEALANAVRDATSRTGRSAGKAPEVEPEVVNARRSHLRALPSPD